MEGSELDGFRLRPYQHDDAAAVAAWFNRFEQEMETAESIQRRFDAYPAVYPQMRWTLEGEDGPIAYAHCVQAQVEKPIFLVRVEVDDAFQHRGLGRALLKGAEKFAREHQASWIMSKVRADLTRERKFLEAAGFTEEQHLYGVELNLETFAPTDAPLPQSYTLTTWNDLGDTPENRRLLYDLYYETDSDTPGIELWGQPLFDEWQESIIESRWFRPEGCLVALDADGHWVALSLIGPTAPTDYTTDFTGVVRRCRGLGLAKALKVAGALWARSQGGLRLHTYNDDRNAAMRAVNARLGFVAKTGWRMMKKAG